MHLKLKLIIMIDVAVMFAATTFPMLRITYASNPTAVSSTPYWSYRWGYPSMLEDNSCAPPCWFGLTPGKSSTKDASQFIITHLNNGGPSLGSELDSATGYVINGDYSFFVGPETRTDRIPYYSHIAINEKIISYISVGINALVTMKDVIRILGLPDYVYLTESQVTSLDLIYVDELVRVSLMNPIKSIQGVPDGCSLTILGDIFLTEYITYFSPQAAHEPAPWSPENAPLQPALLETSFDRDYFPQYMISPKLLEEWLNSSEDIPCAELWANLPETTPVPMPSLVPTVTVTSAP